MGNCGFAFCLVNRFAGGLDTLLVALRLIGMIEGHCVVWHNAVGNLRGSPQFETQCSLGAWLEFPARSVVKLRCYLESLLRTHRSDCERCHVSETLGSDIRQRLEELNLRMQQPHSLNDRDQEEVAQVFDSKPNEAVPSQPASLIQRKKTG